MRGYLYIDGESHFVRSRECAKKIFGKGAELGDLRLKGDGRALQAIDSRAHVLYDRDFVTAFQVHRAVYFTSIVGNDEEAYRVKLLLRKLGCESHVVVELKMLAQQRENLLESQGVIEKAKGVDIAMAVRIIEDAQRNNFDLCQIYTSDVDYLPVIEAVRRMGKDVYVWGYADGLSRQSPLRHVPEQFTDLEVRMKDVLYLPGPAQQQPT